MSPRFASPHPLVEAGHEAAVLLAACAEQVIAAAGALDHPDPRRRAEALDRLEATLVLLQAACRLTERCVADLLRAAGPQPGLPSARGETRMGRYTAL